MINTREPVISMSTVNNNEPIDFILPWVDGSDPDWLNDFNQYKPLNSHINQKNNYRDWDNLKYQFRSFEFFSPWVNKIYFVTYGHVPSWLNLEHEKLVIVKHSDFLKKENLPIFNSHAIEVNLHRIKGLSEKFVYFNDDTFILQAITPQAFFKNNLPVNVAISDVMHEGEIAHIMVNNIDTINKNFNRHIGQSFKKNTIIRQNLSKWFHYQYGFHCIKTLLLMYWPTFTGFVGYHHPQPFLKSSFRQLWEKEDALLNKVSASRFRDSSDVNQYLFKYWQFVTGNFYPDSYKNAYTKRKSINMRTVQDAVQAAEDIKSKRFQMYCPNDTLEKSRYTRESISDEEFKYCKDIINQSLEIIMPDKSSFEQ